MHTLPCTRLRPQGQGRLPLVRVPRAPEGYGGYEISIRLHGNDEDLRRDLNRTENVRLIPEGTKDYERLAVPRPDAESANNSIEEALRRNKASAKGRRRQMVDLLDYERAVNAITLARRRARERLDAAA